MSQRSAKRLRKLCAFKVHKPRQYETEETKKVIAFRRTKEGKQVNQMAVVRHADEPRRKYQISKKWVKAQRKKGRQDVLRISELQQKAKLKAVSNV